MLASEGGRGGSRGSGPARGVEPQQGLGSNDPLAYSREGRWVQEKPKVSIDAACLRVLPFLPCFWEAHSIRDFPVF